MTGFQRTTYGDDKRKCIDTLKSAELKYVTYLEIRSIDSNRKSKFGTAMGASQIMKNIVILCSPTSEDIRPEISRLRGYFFPPLGLLLVAQTLKNAGYEVRFFDGNYNINYKKEMYEYVSNNKDRILYVGFYLAFLQIKDCIRIIKYIRHINPDISVVLGGPFPSVFPDLILKSNLVDVCCIGDGAKVSKDIADALSSNKKSLKSIANIMLKEEGQNIHRLIKERDTLNEGNRIFYENFIDMECYVNKFGLYLVRDYDHSIKRAMPILAGLGCSYKCAFCENALLGHNHISLSAEGIVDQMDYYNSNFNIDSFALFDEDFFFDRKRLYDFIDILGNRDLKIKWGTQCRVNYFHENYINDRLLQELEKVGCVRLSMGAESGSPSMLKKIKKAITAEQVISAAEHGRNSLIYFSYSFIVNLPGETKEDLYMSFRLMDRLVAIKRNSFISAIHYYFAYPGTPLSIEAEKNLGYKIDDLLSFEKFADLSLEEYNNLVNPNNKANYLKCIMHYYHSFSVPFKFKYNIRSVFSLMLRVIGIIRKKLYFYDFPLEIYVSSYIRSAINALRFS